MTRTAFLTTLPDFIEIQRSSFCWFLENGLSEELNAFSSIIDIESNSELNFFGKEYKIQKPNYSASAAKFYNITYSVTIFVPIVIKPLEGFYSSIPKKKTLKTYIPIGELPLMTDRGTFIINGYERVIISQIVRSPGVYFKKSNFKLNSELYRASIIPNRGPWITFYGGPNKKLTVRIDMFDELSIREFFTIFNLKIQTIFESVNYPHSFYKIFKGFKENKRVQNVGLNPSFENTIKDFLSENIFNPKSYEMGYVGRYKLNSRFNLNIPEHVKNLTNQDIIAILDHLLTLNSNNEYLDEIDHLKNRRIRAVGELLQEQFRYGVIRLERNLSKILSFSDPTIINLQTKDFSKPISRVMKEFFGSSQLSQFLNQTNPLSELAHRRRISGLGPGGLTRRNVSFSARDIHASFCGRICLIETPEGENAGLVSALSSYARINSFGFIETPFFNVRNGYVLNKEAPIYLTSEEEETLKIASADTLCQLNGKIIQDKVTVRHQQDFKIISSKEVQLMYVSPFQIISFATALIPFLEHNDANRTMMGASMQKQAVPLLSPTKAIVGTGIETQLTRESGMVLISYVNGFVSFVSNNSICIKNKNGKEILYPLQKYSRSNQNTCINYRPIVWNGEQIQSGQIIADGPGTEGGELALGQNIFIAYMPWEGYNYEDALLISDRLIYADIFTSIHIEKYELKVGYTELGPEKLTNTLPNVKAKKLKNLDTNGIIEKGKFVCAGDILIGKVRPLKQISENPEDKFLNDIFEINYEFGHDCSLRVPKGRYGRVLDIHIFACENNDTSLMPEYLQVFIFIAQIRKIKIGDKLSGRHGNKGIISKILARHDMPYLPNGQPIDLILNPLGVPSRMNVGQLFEGLFGFAGDALDQRFKILPFDEMFGIEASRILISNKLKKVQNKMNWHSQSELTEKFILTDGRTGEFFENPITVCKSYIFKLIHLVEDKIHARSIGPYSLITQQPLSGRSHKGGQRFGEMEVWSLEAFGAAYTLQELLTLKSDDIDGRENAFVSIVKGDPLPKPSIPESFNVLLLNLKALGLDINLYKIKKNQTGKIKAIKSDILKKTMLTSHYKSIEIR